MGNKGSNGSRLYVLEALAPVLHVFIVGFVHLRKVHPPAEDAADAAKALAELAALLGPGREQHQSTECNGCKSIIPKYFVMLRSAVSCENYQVNRPTTCRNSFTSFWFVSEATPCGTFSALLTANRLCVKQ